MQTPKKGWSHSHHSFGPTRKISDLRYQADTLQDVPYRRLQSRMDKDEDGSDPPSTHAELTRAALVQLVVRKEDVYFFNLNTTVVITIIEILQQYSGKYQNVVPNFPRDQ